MQSYRVREYEILVDLLADLLGNSCEVVLHDISDPEHSIVKIRNGHVTGRDVRGPITDLGLKMIKENGPETVLYATKTEHGKLLRCAGLVIRDNQDKIVGFLCINMDITKPPQGGVDFSVPNENSSPRLEHFEMNINDLINSNIQDMLRNMGKGLQDLTREEKLQVLRKLDEKGIFLVRGAVKQVSELFFLSRVSIYKYLAKIRGEQKV
jgi:predicted transcriptional regulator YheO